MEENVKNNNIMRLWYRVDCVVVLYSICRVCVVYVDFSIIYKIVFLF